MLDLTQFAINANLDNKAFKDSVYSKRIDLINIALQWEGTIPKNTFIMHNVWEYPQDSTYKVCFGKYGKEYYEVSSDYKDMDDVDIPNGERKNCNDMKPTIFRNGQIVDSFRARFDDIFKLLEDCGHNGLTEVVKAFSMLFFRNALLIDHTNDNGNYIYNPPQELINFICASMPKYEGVPMEVYIHALDAIGYNEDVKYFTKQLLQKRTGVGRENNMRTYSYAAACVLGDENWAGFIYKLIRGYGVAPITNEMFASYFPEANVDYRQRVPRKRRANSEIITVVESINHY
ncbi:MAG: hypothetical protein KA955_09725 [Prevotella sp.]|nr:hypothetical protein [Prevotella sp.]